MMAAAAPPTNAAAAQRAPPECTPSAAADCSCFLVAVHAGAGSHSPAKEGAYLLALRRALDAAAASLERGSSALTAVREAIRVLEVCASARLAPVGAAAAAAADGTNPRLYLPHTHRRPVP
jgi:hypothetical protein